MMTDKPNSSILFKKQPSSFEKGMIVVHKEPTTTTRTIWLVDKVIWNEFRGAYDLVVMSGIIGTIRTVAESDCYRFSSFTKKDFKTTHKRVTEYYQKIGVMK